MVKKFNKNASNSISFRLVATSCNDPRLANAHDGSTEVPKAALQRVHRPNALKKKGNQSSIPPNLLKAFAPEDFGIHANLECDTREALCNQIYGSPFLPQDKKLVTARSLAEQGSDDLDGDCYFPRDGYNYEIHLVSLDTKSRKFIPAKKAVATNQHLLSEEAEVVDALEDAEGYEELSDDFVPPTGADVRNEHRVIWGGWTPMIPYTVNRSSIPFDKILALYDDDKIGELQEDNEEVMEGAVATLEDFEDLLDEFIQEQNSSKIRISPKSVR